MDDIYKQAISMQNKFHQYIDQPNHEVALQVKAELQYLTDDVEINKNPRSLEDRVKSLVELLHQMETDGIMNSSHISELHDMCLELQQELRRLM